MNIKKHVKFTFLIFFFVFAFISTIKINASTITIPDDYPTIQQGINAAIPGDSIFVRAGTYLENILIEKRLQLIGEDKLTTIIDGGGMDINTIHISTMDPVTVTGFGVINGTTGICIYHCSSITIMSNFISQNTHAGIWLGFSSYNNIEDNIVKDNSIDGILIGHGSHDNLIINNIVENTVGHHGISIHDGSYANTVENNICNRNERSGIKVGVNSFDNVVLNNVAQENYVGIEISESFNNNLIDNEVQDNEYGIRIIFSTTNKIDSCNVFNNRIGIHMLFASDNQMHDNVIYSNLGYGLILHDSPGTLMRRNIFNDNFHNFAGCGTSKGIISDFYQDIDISNTLDGKPIYYWIGKDNLEIPNNAGYVGLVECSNITVKDLSIKNMGDAIFLAGTEHSRILNNSVKNSWIGIVLYTSSNNTIEQNIFSENSVGISSHRSSNNVTIRNNNFHKNSEGIHLWGASDNYIYHNNFIENNMQASDNGSNYWNSGYPDGGNFWSDYSGSDMYCGVNQDELGCDGIGDAPYFFESNKDNYPLMYQWINVIINVKFDSDTNPINPKSKGVIPVTILTTGIADGDPIDLDATTVDPHSVRFGPDEAHIACSNGHIEDVDNDGDMDLLLHFRTQETGIKCDDTEVNLLGKTTSGQNITGKDAIRTVGCGSSNKVVEEENEVVSPEGYALYQNFPNPFNPETEIRFALPKAGNVTVRIYNTLGQEVRTLVNNRYYEAGHYSVNWNSKDNNGHPVSSGIYIYQFNAGNFTQVKMMSLIR